MPKPKIKPPDPENLPCPACFSYDVDPAKIPASAEEHAADMQKAYAAGMTSGFLICRTRSPVFQQLCPMHQQAAQAVIDAVCADLGLPRDKVYADIGVPMPEAGGTH